MKTHKESSSSLLSKGFSLVSLFIAALASSPEAKAYYSTLNTGNIIPENSFQAMVEPQAVLSRYDGFNVVGHFDTGLTPDSSVRGILGFGKVDFQLGALYKFVPFPDTASQPAIGAEAGAIFARVGGSTEFSIRVHPLVSKNFEAEIGDITAYGSIPFGITTRSKEDETVFPVQVALGGELRPLNTPNLSYFTELGFNVNEAFSYISVALAYRFDESSLR